MIKIATCPSCGSDKIKRIRRDLTREFRGQTYTVPDVEFHECRACGEKVFDREAMQRIEAHSPVFARAHPGK